MVAPSDLAVVIPLLFMAAVRALDETHASLHEPPGHQALPAEVARSGIVDAVELLGGFGFIIRGEGLGSLHLHAERQF